MKCCGPHTEVVIDLLLSSTGSGFCVGVCLPAADSDGSNPRSWNTGERTGKA